MTFWVSIQFKEVFRFCHLRNTCGFIDWLVHEYICPPNTNFLTACFVPGNTSLGTSNTEIRWRPILWIICVSFLFLPMFFSSGTTVSNLRWKKAEKKRQINFFSLLEILEKDVEKKNDSNKVLGSSEYVNYSLFRLNIKWMHTVENIAHLLKTVVKIYNNCTYKRIIQLTIPIYYRLRKEKITKGK